MRFETKLSCETIRQRMSIFANPIKSSNYLSEHKFLFKWNTDNSFYLLETGGSFSMMPILPFVGKLDARDNATYIVGKFALARSAKVMLACFYGLWWIFVFFGCFLNSNFDIFGKIFLFIVSSIITTLGYSFFRFFPSLFQKKQQAAVIEFIKKHLLD